MSVAMAAAMAVSLGRWTSKEALETLIEITARIAWGPWLEVRRPRAIGGSPG